jgi:hypothetical protein
MKGVSPEGTHCKGCRGIEERNASDANQCSPGPATATHSFKDDISRVRRGFQTDGVTCS